MTSDAKLTLVPKLRFPEFREEPNWNEKALGTLGQFIRGLTYSADDVAPQGLLVLRSTNIQNGTLVLDRDLVFVRKECPPALRLQQGDIAVCMSNGSKALVGKSAEYAGNYPADLTVGAFCSFFRPAVSFAKLAFQSNEYESYVGDLIAGGNINNLTNAVLEAFCFPIPPTEAEQQKIAECLSTLDELIGAESQKLDALKAHKKGLMQQLFPREGETLPRLRLPEFQDAPEWELKPLSEAAENLDNRRVPITEKDRKRGSVPYYGASGVVDYVQDHIFDEDLLCVSEDGANLVARTYPIAFSISGKTWVNNHAHVLRFENRFTQKMVEDYLNAIDLTDYLTGMAQPKLNKGMLDQIPIRLPDPDEQQRIASCLSSLDDLIAAQNDQVEALKTHKKGLLQQLFPMPEAG